MVQSGNRVIFSAILYPLVISKSTIGETPVINTRSRPRPAPADLINLNRTSAGKIRVNVKQKEAMEASSYLLVNSWKQRLSFLNHSARSKLSPPGLISQVDLCQLAFLMAELFPEFLGGLRHKWIEVHGQKP